MALSDLLSSLFLGEAAGAPSSSSSSSSGLPDLGILNQAVYGYTPTSAQGPGSSQGTGAPQGFGAPSAMPPVARAMQAPQSTPGALAVAGNGATMGPPSNLANATDNQQASTASNIAQLNALMNPTGGTGSNQVGFQPGQGADDGSPALTPIQQKLQSYMTNPNLALGTGALAAAQGMGSAPMGNVVAGMGNAAGNFGQAYNQTMQQQIGLNTPKVTPVGDGSFSMVQVPGQQPQLVANKDVQDYMLGKMKAQYGYEANKLIMGKDMQSQLNANKLDQQNGIAAANSVQTLNQSVQGINAAAQLNNQLKADPARMSNLTWYSTAPAVMQSAAAKGLMGAGYQQAATDAQVLNNASIDSAKGELAGITGSMSDEQWHNAMGAVPKAGDAPQLWDQYLPRVSALLNNRISFYGQVAQRGQDAGNRGVNPYDTSNGRPDIQIPSPPGTGQAPSAPVRVASAADYAKVPPGGSFIDPQGNIRTKPQQGQ